MNKKYLKILPGVAVVLFSTSCCKDDDTFVKTDDIAIVKEQVAGKQVIYLKVRNSSKLSKMALKDAFVKGDQTMDLQFEEGDKVILRFEFLVDEKDGYNAVYIDVFFTATYDETSRSFVITNDPEKMVFNDTDYQTDWDKEHPTNPLSDIAFKNAKELLTKSHTFLSGWSSDGKFRFVYLYWGNQNLEFGNKGYVGFSTMKAMLQESPRSSYIDYDGDGQAVFTLNPNQNRALIVFEDGCEREVTVNDNILDPKQYQYYLVDTWCTQVKIDGKEVSLIDGINYIRTNTSESNDEN